jgi:hypothetical protein
MTLVVDPDQLASEAILEIARLLVESSEEQIINSSNALPLTAPPNASAL